MNKFFKFSLLITAVLCMGSCSKAKYAYETVEDDPLDTKVYTLDNGLKIFMTVNKEQPRIQTYIAVHAGGKDDPAESTGLAHYLEHLMFKGTKSFGTWNYDKEQVELLKIDSLYEVYNKTTDAAARKAIYHQIDSVSYEASRYAIPNEYDKLMATIGADGTNAYTSEDVTCYTEDIPSNQIENWARVQSDRFQNMVIRLFHTELEAVYEEKNISMANDQRKIIEAIGQALYPNHPYGTQTVIGEQEHLKNPSIVNIRKYFENFYRPNNVAICLSGDFDPDEVVDIIQKYFGEWKPNDNIVRKEVKEQPAIDAPIVKDVVGEDAENVWLAWRTPAERDEENVVLDIISTLLRNNGDAGLLDVDLNQFHKVMASECFNYTREQGSEFILLGYPMPGQSLDEVKELLLGEVAKLRKGDFDDRLLQAAITDFKLTMQKMLEENEMRASQYVNAFVAGMQWKDYVAKVKSYENVTKEDVVRVANKYFGEQNYVLVNKHQGTDPNIVQIDKPEINPVMVNRDSVSAMLKEIQAVEVKAIEPKFLDYKKDLAFGKADKDIELICKKNELNGLFFLSYVYDYGENTDRELSMAVSYLNYLGTDKMTVDEFKKQMFALGCTFSTSVTGNRTYLQISGLEENKAEAIKLAENLLANAKVDEEALAQMKSATLQAREVELTDPDNCHELLSKFALYGADYVKQTTLSNNEVMALDGQQLLDKVKSLSSYKHYVIYYGKDDVNDLAALINAEHKTANKLKDTPARKQFTLLPTLENVVYLAHYVMPNSIISGVNVIDKTFDPSIEGRRAMYNEYFGSGMNGVVFQEIRERRGLAYQCFSSFRTTGFDYDPYSFRFFAKTQVDKFNDCNEVFASIINEMPQSAAAFDVAKQAFISRLRSERILREAVLTDYLDALDHGIDYDYTRSIYESLAAMTLADVLDFQKQYVKGRTYTYTIVADRSKIDMSAVSKLGTVKEVNIKDICGYFD